MSKLLKDVAERAVWTYLEAFVTLLVASGMFGVGGVVDLSVLAKLAVAAIAPVLAVIKGFVASKIGNPDSASTVSGVTV